MYQTLVLVPGQEGVFLEHDSKEEALNVLRNIENAQAIHNGERVTAIPLNYKRSAVFTIDVDDIPESKRAEFFENVRKKIAEHQATQKQIAEHQAE